MGFRYNTMISLQSSNNPNYIVAPEGKAMGIYIYFHTLRLDHV